MLFKVRSALVVGSKRLSLNFDSFCFCPAFYFDFLDILGSRDWTLILSEECVFLLTGSMFFFSGEKR